MDRKRCNICGKKAIVWLRYGPHIYCEKHFCEFFEKRVKRVVKKQGLHKFDRVLLLLDKSINSKVMLSISEFFHNQKKKVWISIAAKDPWKYEEKMLEAGKKFLAKYGCDKIFYASDVNFESCRILAGIFGENVPKLNSSFILPFLTTPKEEIKLYAKLKGIKGRKKWHYPKLEKLLEEISERNPSVWFNILKLAGVLKKLPA